MQSSENKTRLRQLILLGGLLMSLIILVNRCSGTPRYANLGKARFLLMGSLGSFLQSNEKPFIIPLNEPPTTEIVLPKESLAEETLTAIFPKPNFMKLKAPASVLVAANNSLNSNPAPIVTEDISFEKGSVNDIEIGIDATSGFIAPTLRYEIVITPTSAIGAHFSYSQNVFAGPKAQVIGGGISYSHYVTGKAFEGLSIDGQLSTYDMTATTAFRRSHITPTAVSALGKWHGRIAKGLNYNAGAGIQFVHLWGRDNGDIEYKNWEPVINVGLGYDF